MQIFHKFEDVLTLTANIRANMWYRRRKIHSKCNLSLMRKRSSTQLLDGDFSPSKKWNDCWNWSHWLVTVRHHCICCEQALNRTKSLPLLTLYSTSFVVWRYGFEKNRISIHIIAKYRTVVISYSDDLRSKEHVKTGALHLQPEYLVLLF